jgi:UDP-N-acetylglucosamine transferase subunit ALG13
MRILVTLGFESFSFDRLVRVIDNGMRDHLIAGEILIQTGHSVYPVRFCESKRFLRFEEIMSCFKKAEIIVGHAGVGTALLCLSLGKIPILFPRRAKYREHVDDHQIRFAQKMEKLGAALVAHDENDLLFKIKQYRPLVASLRADKAAANCPSLREHLGKILGPGPAGKGAAK